MSRSEMIALLEILAETLERAFRDYAGWKRYVRAVLSLPQGGSASNARYHTIQKNARDMFDVPTWFASDSEDPWSFLWICEMLELDHGVVLRKLSILDRTPAKEESLFDSEVRPHMLRLSRLSEPVFVPAVFESEEGDDDDNE